MESNVIVYETKIKRMLEKFLEPGYKFGNEAYLNVLLSHLNGKNDANMGKILQNMPLFTEWLEKAVNEWEKEMITPSPSISSFTLNLASLISVDESNFISLSSKNVYVRLCKILQLRSNYITPGVKLGYLKMLGSFMNHKSGLDWLVSTDYWNDILSYCLENQTIYITREGYNFMYQLLVHFVDVNESFCDLVVKKILSSLAPELFNANGNIRSEIDDVKIQKDFTPSLKLTTHILEKCYVCNLKKVTDIFLKKYNLEATLWSLIMMARDHDFLFNISHTLFIACLAAMDMEKMSVRETAIEIIKEFGKKFFNLMNTLINKGSALNILKLCHLGHIYWDKKSSLMPVCKAKNPIVFENQLIIFQIMPVIVLAFHTSHQCQINKDELTEMFLSKLFKISCDDTIRTAYAYRAMIMGFTPQDSYDLAQKTILYLMKLTEHLHRDRAVIVFQALMYAMNAMARVLIDKNQMVVNISIYQISFLSALLNGLATMIKEFKITWRESVESICLTSLTNDFLSCQNLPMKLGVQGLQLMHLTIANFMPPNLALLVNEVTGDSSVASITPMLYNRFHDPNWEVRDSAFEILQTIAEIAYLKFPAFQKLIIDDKLCQLAVMLSTDDSESFVRASALKSITAMIKVPAFWRECLENEQLPEKMVSILEHESEALVRCEAAKLICEIYEHQMITQNLLASLHVTMANAAIHDLHWEVKVNALDFWDKVINREMTNQGMLDGSFPAVTFSKEHRKIVNLTESEIQSRLNKVLLNLSECGCLGVLILSIQDTCDLQVSKRAVEITKKLSDLLQKYNMFTSSSEVHVEVNIWDTMDNSDNIILPISNPELSNNVIDSIVQCSDVNLLTNCYKKAKIEKCKKKNYTLKIIQPETFKNFINRDLNSLVDDRSKWLNSVDDLGSLLDDILRSYNDNDINNMDCY